MLRLRAGRRQTGCLSEDGSVCRGCKDRSAAVCDCHAVSQYGKLYKRLTAEGRILTQNWELYDGQHVVFQPKQMSVDELSRGTEAAWKHAYSVRSILSRIAAFAGPWGVRLATNLGYRFYAHHLNRFYNCDWIIGRADRTNASVEHPREVALTIGGVALTDRPSTVCSNR